MVKKGRSEVRIASLEVTWRYACVNEVCVCQSKGKEPDVRTDVAKVGVY